MAHGGDGRPPYLAALALIDWAGSNFSLVEGRLAQRGVDAWEMFERRPRMFCSTVYAMIRDELLLIDLLSWEKSTLTRDFELSLLEPSERVDRLNREALQANTVVLGAWDDDDGDWAEPVQ